MEHAITYWLGDPSLRLLTHYSQWHFMKETEPSFELVVINPDVVIGPMLQPVPSPKNVNETNEFACYAFINGTHRAVGDAMFAFWDFVSSSSSAVHNASSCSSSN